MSMTLQVEMNLVRSSLTERSKALKELQLKLRKFRLAFKQHPHKKKIIFGVLSMLLLLGTTVGTIHYRQRQFDQQISDLQQAALEEMIEKTPYKRITGDYSGNDVEDLRPTNLSIDSNDLIQKYGVGIIRIPTIGLELPILEGMTQANLSIGAGTVKPNQRIGRGNFGLLGHYMTDSGLLFGGLRNVSIGDEVEITFYGKTAMYEVQETRIIHQSEGQYMLDNPEDPHYLTLLTCDGSRVGTDYRLMVRATILE